MTEYYVYIDKVCFPDTVYTFGYHGDMCIIVFFKKWPEQYHSDKKKNDIEAYGKE